MYIHQKVIDENGIKIASLPTDIQKMIGQFDSLFQTYKDKLEDGENEDARAVSEKLSILSQEIAKEVKDFSDDETGEELSTNDLQEKVLHRLFQEGKTKLTRDELNRQGYPCANLLGQAFAHIKGAYRVSKRLGNGYCRIEKV